ncbi:hypothetical protein [Acetobacter thailandicus]|uniref:hypothetical protein n=1 Tax=Acetobacter thailandicus TaxID=1502842 RepID=UPI001BA8C753|nr:hypothetical protein [Acetobacter thailandicus]MBS0980822.1 hypothetical protein [Acetobacter thailandicus]
MDIEKERIIYERAEDIYECEKNNSEKDFYELTDKQQDYYLEEAKVELSIEYPLKNFDGCDEDE